MFEIDRILENPLTDESYTNNTYLEILCNQKELIVENKIMKPSKKLIDKVTKALKHNDPYSELMHVFKIYGHFVSKKIILGYKLYIMKCLTVDKYLPRFIPKDCDFIDKDTNNIYCRNLTISEYKNILSQWELFIKPHGLDLSYLVSINGDIVMRNKLEEWVASLKSDLNSLKIITWSDLHPLYEIFDPSLCREFKSVLEINDQEDAKERVLMIGALPIENFSHYYRVNFSTRLRSNNYQLFGKLMTIHGKPINNT
ncbi:27803_t:CDS:1, partial [Gigaspora margarita]